MPNSSWRTLTRPDLDVYSRLKTIWSDRGSPVNHVAQLTLADGGQPSTLGNTFKDIDDSAAAAALFDTHQSVARSFSFQDREGHTFSISIQRDGATSAPGTDAISMSIQDGASLESVASTMAAVRSAFPAYGAGDLSAALGAELGESYRRRESALQQLEAAMARLLDQAVSVRREFDARAAEERSELKSEIEAERTRLHTDLERRNAELTAREGKLAEEQQKLDDRSNTHARRELLRDLRKKFEARNTSFRLTPETEAKRTAVTAGFVVLVVASALFATYSVGSSFVAFRAGPAVPAPERWLLAGRAFLSAAALIGAAVFYIRWADSWTERHAAEEFKLKRLELDMDRASWVVEMALEWKEAKGSQIPPELLLQLTRNLFETESGTRRVQHPAEDLASALLGATSSLRVGIPGVGEATLDRKAVRRFQESARSHGDGDGAG